MIRTDRRLRACKVLLIAELIFIWGNSLMPGEISGAISDGVGYVLRLIFEQGPQEESGGFPLRKLAHFTEFAALGMTLSWLFGMLPKSRGYALLFGVLTAATDETIQIFVPDRGPSVRDVALDSCGVLAGMILLCLGHSYYIKHKRSGGKIHEKTVCFDADSGTVSESGGLRQQEGGGNHRSC